MQNRVFGTRNVSFFQVVKINRLAIWQSRRLYLALQTHIHAAKAVALESANASVNDFAGKINGDFIGMPRNANVFH